LESDREEGREEEGGKGGIYGRWESGGVPEFEKSLNYNILRTDRPIYSQRNSKGETTVPFVVVEIPMHLSLDGRRRRKGRRMTTISYSTHVTVGESETWSCIQAGLIVGQLMMESHIVKVEIGVSLNTQ
jgi:hypothetical protein